MNNSEMNYSEMKAFLKSKGFMRYHNLSRNNLNKLVDDYKRDNEVPHKFSKKKKNNLPCSVNENCKSNLCYDGICRPVPNKQKKLAPLFEKTKMDLQKVDRSSRCYKLSNIDMELKSYQKKVVKFMRDTSQKGILLLHNVGSGKTITSLIAAKCILSKHPNMKVIVLTPSSVVKQFENELYKLNLTAEMSSRFDVYSHQLWLDRFEANMVNAKNTVLIVDEAHKFKTEHKTSANVTGKYVYLLSRAALQSFKVILLSATPIENDIKEIRNYLAMIGNKDLHDFYKEVHGQIEDSKKVDILQKDYTDLLKCKVSYHTHTKRDYPETIEKNIRIHMTKQYFDAYKQVENVLFSDVEIKNIFQKQFNKVTDINKFYTGIRKSVNKIKILSPKLKWVINKISSRPDHKSLIYSSWLEFGVNQLMIEFDNLNIKYKTISGDVSQLERGKIVDDFNNNKFNILLITSAGAEGLNLKCVRQVFLLEPFWHRSRIDQVIGRAIRFKSHISLPEIERNVTVYNLILIKPQNMGQSDEKESADEIMFKMSQQKCSVIEQFYQQIKNASIENNQC